MLKGATAVLTGSGRGIGACAARLYGREGARVVVNDLHLDVAEAVAAEIRASGGEAMAVGGSVTDDGFPEHLMATAAEAYGGKIDILVNNAGFTWDGVIHKMTDKQWQAVLDCHSTAPFRMIRAAVPYMRDVAKAEMMDPTMAGKPADRCIINVSSTSGLHGNAGQANYAMAKAGIIGLTKTVAKEWGPLGIRCNAVAFGMIDTRMTQGATSGEGGAVEVDGEAVAQGMPDAAAAMWREGPLMKMATPLGRLGTPEEAAGGILMLASPFASYVTGHTLEVTGGMGI
jgi:3-oxoacyl-[acyl-carrier protein] reductase